MYKLHALLCLCALAAGCSSKPDIYQTANRTAEGPRQGARLIESSGNATIAARTDGTDQGDPSGQAPRLVKTVAPAMPKEAIDQGIEGSVLAELQVDATGKVSSVKILRSPHALLSDAVVRAMSQWAFSPKVVNGAPEGFKLRQTYTFRVEP